jgi:hypothetical protein
MPWLGILIVAVVVGFGVLMVIGRYMMAQDAKKQARVLEEGEPVLGWVIMANKILYEADDIDDSSATFVLIAKDPEVGNDEDYMTALVEEVKEIIESESRALETDDEHEVHDYLQSHKYIEGAKLKIPKSITQGKVVYLCHLFVFRKDLPRRKIAGHTIHCAICWDQPGTMICSRPAPKKKRRKDDEDDEV